MLGLLLSQHRQKSLVHVDRSVYRWCPEVINFSNSNKL